MSLVWKVDLVSWYLKYVAHVLRNSTSHKRDANAVEKMTNMYRQSRLTLE